MDEERLRAVIDGVAEGTVPPDEALRLLRRLPFADLGHTRVDHHRRLRQGLPEAVYAPGKSPGEVADIVAELLGGGTGPVVVTRTDADQRRAALEIDDTALVVDTTLVWRPAPPRPHRVLVVTAGTADGPVATEAEATLLAAGLKADRINDVGVAGLHRILSVLDELAEADLVIVVAGMEGALPSVVTGLVSVPVVAVPTSVGYGAGLEGVTALLGMLAACASGLTVVGIDNGFGAAVAAARMLDVGR